MLVIAPTALVTVVTVRVTIVTVLVTAVITAPVTAMRALCPRRRGGGRGAGGQPDARLRWTMKSLVVSVPLIVSRWPATTCPTRHPFNLDSFERAGRALYWPSAALVKYWARRKAGARGPDHGPPLGPAKYSAPVGQRLRR